MAMTSQFSHMTSSSVFLTFFVSLVTFSYWSKFHINIITGSGVMTISFYKGLTRNPEIGNTPVWVLPNIWRLGRVMDTKFGTNVSNRMLLNAAKCQGYSFYRFWVIKGKPRGVGRGVKKTRVSLKFPFSVFLRDIVIKTYFQLFKSSSLFLDFLLDPLLADDPILYPPKSPVGTSVWNGLIP